MTWPLLYSSSNKSVNISFADTLINYEQNWNKAVMEQRAGRIHRINSTFDKVDIVNMMTNETIDEKIEKALELKKALSDGLIERNEKEQDIMKVLLEAID